jgi:hypothetical protein
VCREAVLLGMGRWCETRQAASLRDSVIGPGIEKADTRSALEFCGNHQKLLRSHQRVCDGVDGERDAVLHSDFAHQFRYVRFYGALLDAQG